MQERQQDLVQQQQLWQQELYDLQIQQQLMKQKILQGNLQPSPKQSHMQQQQQQQQQNLFPPPQLQSSQKPVSVDSTAQTGHANGVDWQEEVYQKIKAMKETYLLELNEMHEKIAAKLLQHDSLPQQPKSEQLEKLKIFKALLERSISFLSVSKTAVLPTYKDKLSSYEKQIINIINTNRLRKPVPALQPQGQFPSTHLHSMQQPQPQINQTRSHDNQMNPQLRSINLQGSLSATVVTMVDEAAAVVGENLAAMKKHGLHARNFFTQTGMTGAEKMRCYVSALVILALIFWFTFIHKSPILKH